MNKPTYEELERALAIMTVTGAAAVGGEECIQAPALGFFNSLTAQGSGAEMHALGEVVAVLQVALSKLRGLEPPQPLLDAVKGADKERVQRNATAAVMRYVQCHKDTNSAS